MTLTREEQVADIKKWMLKTHLEADVTKDTVHYSADHVDPQLLLATSKKLIKINKGEATPDDRDNLKYSKFYDLADRMKEHIDHDVLKLQSKAKMKIKQKKNLSWLHAGFFTPQARNTITGAGTLVQLVDEGNPIYMLDASSKATKLGAGGISSTQSVPDSTRSLHPSYAGLLDGFRLSEGLDIGTSHRFANDVKKGDDGSIYKKVLDKEGKEVWIDHNKYLTSKILIPEE